MLDIQFIREHTDIVKESQRKRGESVELVDEVLSSDTARREALKAFEEARAQQKEIGKKVASAPADEKAKLIAETKELSQKVSEYKSKADSAAEEYTTAMWKLSNIVEPEAPELPKAARMTTWSSRRLARFATSRPKASSPRTT